MLELIVMGHIPGTGIIITFPQVALVALIFLFVMTRSWELRKDTTARQQSIEETAL